MNPETQTLQLRVENHRVAVSEGFKHAATILSTKPDATAEDYIKLGVMISNEMHKQLNESLKYFEKGKDNAGTTSASAPLSRPS